MGSNREKSNIAIAILDKWRIGGGSSSLGDSIGGDRTRSVSLIYI